ncbi:MAG: transglycosylase SLT domain-containing protein [Chloracidobacterium sp.]|nr:transglycosylase SLT domain-containing protein [Chloracidobacterium sp.]
MFERSIRLGVSFLLLAVLFTVGCSAQQNEEQALRSLREMTRNGKLPPEDFVAGLESRFAGKKTGALAKLLHARIRYDNGDFTGAAAILNADVFAKKTKLADHALWLRGQALQKAGNHADAAKAFETLIRNFPDFIRVRDAKLAWATSAISASRAIDIPPFLIDLTEKNDADALLLTAKAFEAQGLQADAIKYYRRTYFFAAGSTAAKEAETKLTSLAQPLTPQTSDEQLARAEKLFNAKSFADAASAYSDLAANFPAAATPQTRLKRLTALANSGKMPDALTALNSLPESSKEREEAHRQLVLGYAKAKMWPQARSTADEMKQRFPYGTLVAKTFIDAGFAARDAKNRTDEAYFLNRAVAAFPNAVEVAQAQFETAWMQHENKNFALSSQMFIDHLARYADKDTASRGKAGYWAARDSERSGKINEACALYDAVIYRYSANWYGYLAFGRLTTLKNQGNCRTNTAVDPTVTKAIANLKTVTVAAETAIEKEVARTEKSEELSTIGLFDWAIDELQEAKKTAEKSPKINLALAKHYRLKGDNVNALLALAKSYPDYAQMFPEEMGREEWEVFYPLLNWAEIKYWASERQLDPYQVAGLIRQESVFNPQARSHANAFGLMQLLVPTAQSMAKKYVSKTSMVTSDSLYQPPLNIELGTAYMKDQLAKFGRIEYMAVAYNAGPGRVPQWRATLPAEMDEFVEAIPFKETKGYVQGVIRNSAQYRRLYDESGNFKQNVGTRPLRGEIDSKPHEEFVAEYPDINIDDRGE